MCGHRRRRLRGRHCRSRRRLRCRRALAPRCAIQPARRLANTTAPAARRRERIRCKAEGVHWAWAAFVTEEASAFGTKGRREGVSMTIVGGAEGAGGCEYARTARETLPLAPAAAQPTRAGYKTKQKRDDAGQPHASGCQSCCLSESLQKEFTRKIHFTRYSLKIELLRRVRWR